MNRFSNVRKMMACGVGVLLAGCSVGADFFNPAVFTGLGFDPNTIVPNQGTIIVQFNNQTEFPVSFATFEASNPNDLTRDSRNFIVNTQAGESRNEVLDCPVRVLAPGVLDDAGAYTPAAALVIMGAEGGTEVPYGGAPLQVGADYACGDVIEIRVTQVNTGGAGDEPGEVAFQLAVQVRPGR